MSKPIFPIADECVSITIQLGTRALTEAYNNQFNVPQLTGELTPQPSVRGMTKVSLCSSSALDPFPVRPQDWLCLEET